MSSNEIKVGSKVKVIRMGTFYSKYFNKVGTVVGLHSGCQCTVKFDDTIEYDYGNVADCELITNAPTKPKRSEWFPKALELHKQGKKSKHIAKALGVPERTVRHNLQKYREESANLGVKLHEIKLNKAVQVPTLIGVNAILPKRPTIFIIPDTQCKQGVDLDYMHHIGNYIKLKRPDIIVHLGDHYDMASLSVYDKGKLSAEGKRYQADIEAGDEGIRILESYIQSVPNYSPRKVVTLGNHEDRIDRFVQDNPNFEGTIGTDKLAFVDYGWEVHPFLTPVNICGINFVHYLQNTMTGKPLGGTALNRLKSVGESFVMGHVQTYDFCQRPLPLTGKHQIGLIVGACYEHDESYKGVQGNHHFRGCVMLYECADGYAMHKAITLRHMRELYERAN